MVPVPSDAEWTVLQHFLAEKSGGKMKETDTITGPAQTKGQQTQAVSPLSAVIVALMVISTIYAITVNGGLRNGNESVHGQYLWYNLTE